jgi:hypothetical protein
MVKKKGGRGFSLNYLFASFFGAAMIAGAFAYFNYKFSQYKFIDFREWVFYEKRDIFTPDKDRYFVIVYSSNMQDIDKLLHRVNKKYHIIVLDLYQKRRDRQNGVVYITSGINTLLKFIQRFNIYGVPSGFWLKRHKGLIYKQDSMVKTIQ